MWTKVDAVLRGTNCAIANCLRKPKWKLHETPYCDECRAKIEKQIRAETKALKRKLERRIMSARPATVSQQPSQIERPTVPATSPSNRKSPYAKLAKPLKIGG